MKTKKEIINEFKQTIYRCGEKVKYEVNTCFMIKEDDMEEDEIAYALISSNYFAPANYEVVSLDWAEPVYMSQEEIDKEITSGHFVLVE